MEETVNVEKKAPGFFSEFWKFAAKGNVFDLAIAVILGNAFSAIVNSLVSDIITPLLSLLTNNVNLNTYAYVIREARPMASGTTSPAIVLGYGHLLQSAVNFIIIALSIFLMFKLVTTLRNRIARKEEEHPETKEPPAEEKLLTEIRDLLKERTQKNI